MNQTWSWVLMVYGVAGLYLVGKRKRWWTWLIGLSAQVLWVAYAIETRQWGFIMSAFAYGWVYALNAMKWHKEQSAGLTIEEVPE